MAAQEVYDRPSVCIEPILYSELPWYNRQADISGRTMDAVTRRVIEVYARLLVRLSPMFCFCFKNLTTRRPEFRSQDKPECRPQSRSQGMP